MLVYLSGPISAAHGWTVEENAAAAIDVYYDLIKDGINAICPHLSCSARTFEISYERWIEYDFALIDVCTHVLMLPRWETSKGACRERDYALSINKMVLYDIQEVYDRKDQ